MRRWKLVAGVAGLALVATAAYVARPLPSRVTRDNLDRVRNGMTLSEVEAILGPCVPEQAIDISDLSSQAEWDYGVDSAPLGYRVYEYWFWRGPTGVAMIRYDAHARVIQKMWVPWAGKTDRLKRQLREWLP